MPQQSLRTLHYDCACVCVWVRESVLCVSACVCVVCYIIGPCCNSRETPSTMIVRVYVCVCAWERESVCVSACVSVICCIIALRLPCRNSHATLSTMIVRVCVYLSVWMRKRKTASDAAALSELRRCAKSCVDCAKSCAMHNNLHWAIWISLEQSSLLAYRPQRSEQHTIAHDCTTLFQNVHHLSCCTP